MNKLIIILSPKVGWDTQGQCVIKRRNSLFLAWFPDYNSARLLGAVEVV